MTDETFPRLERGPLIEVPRPRNGRPGYAWVQGWVVRYSETLTSVPTTYHDALNLMRTAPTKY